MSRVLGVLAAGVKDPDGEEQKRVILEFASENNLSVEEFFVRGAGRGEDAPDFLSGLLEKVERGDTLLMQRLACLSDTSGEAFRILDRLAMKGICVTSLEQGVNTCALTELD